MSTLVRVWRILLVMCGAQITVFGATRTWSNAAGGEWATSSNWSGGQKAGAGDQAKFDQNITGAITNAGAVSVRYITLDTGVRSITFGSPETGAFTLGSGGDFTALGSITATNPFTATFNAPVVLAPASGTTAGSYTFKSAHPLARLVFNGSISGGSTTAGITLTLTGSDANSGDNVVSGAISDGGAGAGLSLVKTGGNKWTLSNTSSSFTGSVSINAGTLSVPAIGTAGQPSPFGANGTINVGGTSPATLIYTGTGETTDKVLNLAGPGGVSLYSSGTGAIVFTSDFTATGTGNKTVSLRGNFSDATNEISGRIVDNSSTNKTSLLKGDSGRWKLSGASTFTGSVSLRAGVTTVTSLGTVGNPSPLGKGSVIDLGNGESAATLIYVGAGETSDKTINLAGTTGSISLYSVGTGALILTCDLTATGAGSKSLYLRGENNGFTSEVRGAIVDNSSTHRTSVVKSDGGSWRLLGTNTYTGSTIVNAGTLSLGDGSSSSPSYISDLSDVYVNGNARLALDFAASSAQETVRTLYLDDIPMAAGTWGPLGNTSATYHDAKLTGTGVLVVSFQAPRITTAPADRNVMSGTGVVFTVSATGSPTLVYQWHKDGVPLSGATDATLTLASVAEPDAGIYSVTVSNSVGEASVEARLVVDDTAPSVPSGLYYTNATSSSIVLHWLPSIDNIGVTEYEVRQDGILIGTTSAPSKAITGLISLTVYEFTVRARDAAGNWSDWSMPFSIIGDPDGNPDGDGLTNQEEYILGTDPVVGESNSELNLNVHRPQN